MTRPPSSDHLSQLSVGRPSVDSLNTASAWLASVSCFLTVRRGASLGIPTGLCPLLSWVGLKAQPFPKLYLAVSPSSLPQDLGKSSSFHPDTMSTMVPVLLSLLLLLGLANTQNGKSGPRAGYGKEWRGGNEKDRHAGRGRQMKPGFPDYSSHGCWRLSANLVHTLPEVLSHWTLAK